MRVLISGMGGQLGTLVAQRFEALDDVELVAGYDLDPPRRRLRHATFRWISPADTDGLAAFVRDVDPTVVCHLGIYEPHARLAPLAAGKATIAGTTSLIGALGRSASTTTVVVRSGIELYGRRRGGPMLPDEDTLPEPTSAFGRSLLEVEQLCGALTEQRDVAVTPLRFASVVGARTPSPLSRVLRLGVVPVPALAEPTFAMVHAEDAADAIVAAALGRTDSPVNVVAPGVVSAYQAARLGGRIPMPLAGAGWRAAGWAAEMAGAPLPEHLRESLTRGRCADGGRCRALLGVAPTRSARDILAEVHDFAPVEYLPVADDPAA